SRACAPLMGLRAAPAELEDKTLREQTSLKEEDERKVVLQDVTVSEGLSPETVLSIIRKKIIAMEKSFLASEPGGKLILRLAVGQDGKVKNVNILSSFLKNGRFQQAIIEQVKKWQFPATQGGREAKITFSLVFAS
ncbi:MAG: AgmX/PglI C-terminal domain-containing protein, partial [Deltaproteobacteria bacterium]|nr:AgmX/PglI C-terminal domain-containing protein [Deltaproteobacteria bacterium]